MNLVDEYNDKFIYASEITVGMRLIATNLKLKILRELIPEGDIVEVNDIDACTKDCVDENCCRRPILCNPINRDRYLYTVSSCYATFRTLTGKLVVPDKR